MTTFIDYAVNTLVENGHPELVESTREMMCAEKYPWAHSGDMEKLSPVLKDLFDDILNNIMEEGNA